MVQLHNYWLINQVLLESRKVLWRWRLQSLCQQWEVKLFYEDILGVLDVPGHKRWCLVLFQDENISSCHTSEDKLFWRRRQAARRLWWGSDGSETPRWIWELRCSFKKSSHETLTELLQWERTLGTVDRVSVLSYDPVPTNHHFPDRWTHICF